MPHTRLAWVCLTLLTACSAPSAIPMHDAAVIYVIQRDWHTDIGLPAEEVSGPLARLEQPFPGVRFLTFGFGERQFLVNRRTNFGAMLRALLPSESALLMTALGAAPERAFGADSVVTLHVSNASLERIEAAIWQEIETSAEGEPTVLGKGPYPGSLFYAARDTYDMLYTCNTWTADILRAGGLPMPEVLFAGQVMGMVRWIATRQLPTGRSATAGEQAVSCPRELNCGRE